jgi:hypothetical protein
MALLRALGSLLENILELLLEIAEAGINLATLGMRRFK